MSKKLYRVRFVSEDKVYEIYAKHVFQGTLYGFVMVEDLVFDESSSVVVDPQQERIKREFEGVTQTYIPLHAVLRVDEVEKQGTAKISVVDHKIANFPSPIYTPNSDRGGE